MCPVEVGRCGASGVAGLGAALARRRACVAVATDGSPGRAEHPVKLMSKLSCWVLRLTLSVSLACGLSLYAQVAPTNAPASGQRRAASRSDQVTAEVISRLRDEGLNRSQVMETLIYLTDVIGPRLNASPNHRRACEWTRARLASWGLTNARLESWPFGRGWSLHRFSAQIIAPQTIPLVAWPAAWSAGSDWPLVGDVVYVDGQTEAELERFKGRLKGAVALVSSPRTTPVRFEPLATRLTEAELLRLANAVAEQRDFYTWRARSTNPPPRAGLATATNQPQAGPATNPPSPRRPARVDVGARLRFAAREGAAVIVTCSAKGEGGPVAATTAAVLPPESQGTNQPVQWGRSPWATNVPPSPPQIVLAAEDYGRLVRMLERGEQLRMAVELQVQFHTNDLTSWNVLAELPGTDLKDQVVMLGAHLDSLHVGTGATDNAAGVAVCMEAVRLLRTLGLQPRRTIRIALWGGEEQGYLGSRAYLRRHVGYFTNATEAPAARAPRQSDPPGPRRRGGAAPERKLVRLREYDRISVYFNLDNGGGKIRGIYLQGNEAVRPLFQRWLQPFRDLGAETVSAARTGGTDHVPFDEIGIPAFQFIQDPLDYMSRSHHTTADVTERIQAEDLKQAAVIMAAFVYQAAMLDEMLPRKPLPGDQPQ